MLYFFCDTIICILIYKKQLSFILIFAFQVFVGFFLTPSITHAAGVTYYVANAGNDACDGTSQTIATSGSCAWKTIAHINSRTFQPGDSILFNRGDTWLEQLIVPSSGVAGNQITFGAYSSGAAPVISGSKVVPTNSWIIEGTQKYTIGFTQPVAVYENGVVMNASLTKAGMNPGSWWWDSVNSRVYLRATGDVNPSTENIEIPQRTSCITTVKNYTTITNLDCEKASIQGVYSTGNYDVIENMLIQHIRSNIPNIVGGPSFGYSNFGDGIYWKGSNTTIENNTVVDAEWAIIGMMNAGSTSDSNLIQGNDVSRIGFDAIAFGTGFTYPWGFITNSVAQYNVVHEIGLWGLRGGGIEFTGGGAGDTNIIRYNVLYNNGLPNNTSFPLNVQGGAGYGTFYGNVVYNNYGSCLMITFGAGHNKFYNNTCYNNGLRGAQGAGFYLNGGTRNTANILKNNIIYAGAGKTVLKVEADTVNANIFDNNLYYGGSATPFSWAGVSYNFTDYKTNSGEDSNSLNTDPQFTNTSANDFTLLSSSPAINSGLNLGTSYKMGLNSVSSWPLNVQILNQDGNGSSWDIGAYVYDENVSVTPPSTHDNSGGSGSGSNNGSGNGGGGGGSTYVPPPEIPITIPGCGDRTSGFSLTTGQSCTGNIPGTTISGCGNRTIGFSITTGQTCVGNTSTRRTYDFGTITLRNGSRGDAVMELQRFLNDTINLGLVVDGKLGPKTIAVIMEWQSAHGLVADGLVGAKTKAIMNAQ